MRINYRRIFAKTTFSHTLNSNTCCYYHLKEECLHFHSDLKCIRCVPHVWHGRCPGDTPIPAKPSQACLVWRSRLRCSCALAILVVSFDVVGRKHCPWRNPIGRNHTQSGLVTGVARCRKCRLCPLRDQPIDLAVFIYATMKLQTFFLQMVVTSCISFQYLGKYGFEKSSDNLYAPCIISFYWGAISQLHLRLPHAWGL